MSTSATTTILVHHPHAGGGSHRPRNLVASLEANGLGPVSHHLRAQEAWRRAVADHRGLVVAAGGDGTVADVLLEARGAGSTVGIVPLGTANNLARQLAVDVDHPERAIRQMAGGSPVDLDLPAWRAGARTGLLVESVGMGILPDLIQEADRAGVTSIAEARRLLEELVATAEPWSATVEIDGVAEHGSFLGAQVLNIGRVGPNVVLTGRADPTDGATDVVLLEAHRRDELLERLRAGTDATDDLDLGLPHRRARTVRITAHHRVGRSVDDTVLPPGTGLCVDVRTPAQVAVVLPAGDQRSHG